MTGMQNRALRRLRLDALNGARVVYGVKHGTRTAYVHHGCRCDACRDAEADYQHVRPRRNRKQGAA